MSKQVSALITNNIIALVIHICICFILFYPPVLIIPILLRDDILLWFAMGLYTIIAFGLYFFAGRLFLRNTKNMLTDLFSVIVLTIVFLAIVLYWYWLSSLIMFLMPFFMLAMLISHILPIQFEIDEILILFLLPLPSLTMWVGLRAKKYVDTLLLQHPQSIIKNRFTFIIGNKKVSSILLIALICLTYLLLLLGAL